MIYLNADFEGGATTFFHESQQHYSRPLSETVLHSFRANVGSCLVFNHRLCHDGSRVMSGVKYILRTEVMYKRQQLSPNAASTRHVKFSLAEESEARPEVCAVCDSSGMLLSDPCPLCCDEAEPSRDAEHPYHCKVCDKEMQSAISYADHLKGRKHLNRMARSGANAATTSTPTLPPLSEMDFFTCLAGGRFRNIVVCTGAGVSAEAGIADFRSPGGLFEVVQDRYGERFPELLETPEDLLSRSFAQQHPETWEREVLPWLSSWKLEEAKPAAAHKFCAWLHRCGWLRRVYTQNVDGLHTHEDLGLPRELVVECHGSFRDGSIVLYGDPMPGIFDKCCRADFLSAEERVDLLLVMGTSLQVAPFCAVPNLAPKGCIRVLVNNRISHCLSNSFSKQQSFDDSLLLSSSRSCSMYDDMMYPRSVRMQSTVNLGGFKAASLRPLWKDGRRWQQLLAESSCCAFIERFFSSSEALARELSLE